MSKFGTIKIVTIEKGVITLPDTDVIKQIKDLCQAYSWTYYRLAKESGITCSTLNAMINKGTIPSVPTLKKLCDGFGISLSQFFAEDEAVASLTDTQKRHLANWESLNEESKDFLEQFILFLKEQQSR